MQDIRQLMDNISSLSEENNNVSYIIASDDGYVRSMIDRSNTYNFVDDPKLARRYDKAGVAKAFKDYNDSRYIQGRGVSDIKVYAVVEKWQDVTNSF